MRYLWTMVMTVMVACPVNNEAQDRPVESLLRETRPLVIAHRGYSGIAPENTRAAFQLGLAAGADLVELDYHHTRDAVPVVIHDGTLDRTTDATNRWGGRKLAVSDYTIDQVRGLDAGRWFGLRWAGERLLTLEEAITIIQAQGITLVERKGGDARAMVRLLQERDWLNRLVVQSFDWEYLRKVHELEPRQVLGALGPTSRLSDGREPVGLEKPLSVAWLNEAVKTGARVVVWNREVSQESVREAHARGLKVWIYTINEPGLANALLDLGVDGLITDQVGILWRTLALRGFTRSFGVAP